MKYQYFLKNDVTNNYNFDSFFKWTYETPLLRCMNEKDDVELPLNFKKWVIVGTGGSMLGPKAFASISSNSNVKFLHSIDPISVQKILSDIDFKDTGFLVISKSGKTTETLKHFLELKPDNTIIMSEINFHKHHIPFEKDIGGRFCMFSNVGKVTSKILGLDFDKFIAGAKKALNESSENDFFDRIIEMVKSPIHVIWTYGDRLEDFSKWLVQLFAESLGKKNKNGTRVGQTPITSKGPDDQHSLLQLYLDGPLDKYFSMMHLNESDPIPNKNYDGNHNLLKKLSNISFQDLMSFCFESTKETLVNHNIPGRSIVINDYNEFALGYLMMRSVLEVIAMSIVLDVNPFDQPAVEEVKIKIHEKIDNKYNNLCQNKTHS